MDVREIALKLLCEWEADGKYANLSLSNSRVRSLSERERAWLTVLFYTTVEHKLTYDYIIGALSKREIDKIDIITKNILRLGLCQVLHISSLPDYAAVSETVRLARHKGEKAFVNGILRALVRAKEKGEVPMPDRKKNAARYLSVYYSFPLPVVKYFVGQLGERECEELLRSFAQNNYTDLTVNTTKITRSELIELISARGVYAKAHPDSELTVRIDGSVDPTVLYGFDKGYFYVQDAACAISALALGIKAGDKVLDTCAAPGGKSFAAAILGAGSVYAFDLHESKLSLIQDGAERLGLRMINAGVRDALEATDVGVYDKVICDVPCSGLGVLGKKPDLRYRDMSAIEELPELQYAILNRALDALKVGGVLIYSTCTLNKSENEDVVLRALAARTDISFADFSVGSYKSTGGMLTLLPHRDKTDGFFIARLKKDK